MGDRVDAFAMMTKALKALGYVRPDNTRAYRYWTIFSCLLICAGTEFTLITIYGTITEDSSIFLKLEYTSFIYTNVSMTFRLILMTIKKKEIFSLFDKIESLLQEMELENGTNSLPALREKCKKWAYFLAFEMFAVCMNAYVMAYVKYYVDGVEDPAPFEVALPFEKKNNIHAVVWYGVFQFYSSVAVVAVTNIVLATLASTTSELIRKVAECFERINESNADHLLGQTIEWHSKVIMLTNETNSLFGLTIFVDFILSLQYISVGGFLLVKIGLTNTTNFSKYMMLYMGFLLNPIFYSIGGHEISVESDKLYTSLYNNEWYHLSPKGRKNFILPTLIARRGLSWNFVGFLYFDMALYLALVKQSYSMIAFLKLVS